MPSPPDCAVSTPTPKSPQPPWPIPSTGSPRRSSHRLTCCCGGGTLRTRKSRTSGGTRAATHVLGGMGLVVLHSGHFARSSPAAGDYVLAEVAQRGRTRARVDGEALAPDRPGIARPVVIPAAGNVRRAVRHSGARRADLHQLVQRRRGVPLRLPLPARRGPDLLLQRRATRTTRSTTSPRSRRSSPTPSSGRRPSRAARRRRRPNAPRDPGRARATTRFEGSASTPTTSSAATATTTCMAPTAPTGSAAGTARTRCAATSPSRARTCSTAAPASTRSTATGRRTTTATPTRSP